VAGGKAGKKGSRKKHPRAAGMPENLDEARQWNARRILDTNMKVKSTGLAQKLGQL
jgi:hypothetical protein